MRKYSLILLVVLLAVALGMGAVACGSSKTGSGLTPEEALTAAMDGIGTTGAQSGTYELAITIDADSSSDPALQMFTGQPLNVTGDFAFQMEPVLADATMGLNMMGMNIGAGIRVIHDQAWLDVLGQWYTVPMEDYVQDVGADAAMAAAVQGILEQEGIDPHTWYKDLKVEGTETLAGTEVTHLRGSLDFKKIMSDVATLMNNPELGALVGQAAQAQGAGDITMPAGAEMDEALGMVEDMFKNATFDLWLADADNSLRKLMFNVDVEMPEEAAGTGIGGINMLLTANLTAPGADIQVTAPPAAKPIEALQNDLMNNPLLSGFLGGGSGLDGILGM